VTELEKAVPETRATTKKVVYVGESSGRDISVRGGCIRAERGVPFEVPAALAASLLEQDVFELAKGK